MAENLIPKHGGYRRLKSFQIARLVFDITIRFGPIRGITKSNTRSNGTACSLWSPKYCQRKQASGTSKKTELKLTNVARASLKELRLDYQDFLRQHSLILWDSRDPRRQELVNLPLESADAFAQ